MYTPEIIPHHPIRKIKVVIINNPTPTQTTITRLAMDHHPHPFQYTILGASGNPAKIVSIHQRYRK